MVRRSRVPFRLLSSNHRPVRNEQVQEGTPRKPRPCEQSTRTAEPYVSARVDVTGNPYQLGSGYGALQAFNPTVFALPAVGTLGDPSKNLVRGPGIENWNISLVKGIPVWERVHMQFRLEMYNAFNHTQFSTMNTTATFNAAGAQTNTQFGQYTAARDPRIMQWAVRVQF